MANAWLAHVKRTMKAHKGQKFSAVLKLAKKSYHKGKKHHGGADGDAGSSSDSSSSSDGAASGVEVPALGATAPTSGGRRRRSSRRTRRHRRR